MSKFGGGAKCPCCTKTVYMAEEVLAGGNKYHKLCFKCTECNKMLDSTTAAYHENKLFCKSCHSRGFGLKGYGYGQGAGTLASEAGLPTGSGAPQQHNPTGTSHGTTGYSSYGVTKGSGKSSVGGASKFGSQDRCPRCGKAVYMAEKVVGAGSAWHKSCFNCSVCNKKLDSTTVADKEGEIYCKCECGGCVKLSQYIPGIEWVGHSLSFTR